MTRTPNWIGTALEFLFKNIQTRIGEFSNAYFRTASVGFFGIVRYCRICRRSVSESEFHQCRFLLPPPIVLLPNRCKAIRAKALMPRPSNYPCRKHPLRLPLVRDCAEQSNSIAAPAFTPQAMNARFLRPIIMCRSARSIRSYARPRPIRLQGPNQKGNA